MIPAGGCTVWWATPAMYRSALCELLDTDERSRLQALRRDADRVRFVLAAALLRLAAASALGAQPDHVTVRRTCPDCGSAHGRPQLPGTDLHASISHSGERVAVAITRLAPIGVDVQCFSALDVGVISARILDDSESAATDHDFYTYWTRKEAMVKATGDGMRVPLRQVLVGAADTAPRLLSYPGRPGLVASLLDLSAGDGYAAALAVLHHRCGPLAQLDASSVLAGAAAARRE